MVEYQIYQNRHTTSPKRSPTIIPSKMGRRTMRPTATVKSTEGKHGEAALLRKSTFPIVPEKAHWKKLHGKSSSKNSKRQNLPWYTRKKPLRAKRAILTTSCLAHSGKYPEVPSSKKIGIERISITAEKMVFEK
jgi:hypothetical protein